MEYVYLVGAWESLSKTMASWFDTKWNGITGKTIPTKPSFYTFGTFNTPTVNLNGVYDRGVFFNEGELSKWQKFNHTSDDIIAYSRDVLIDVSFPDYATTESVILHMNDIVQKYFPNQSTRIKKSDNNDSAIANFAENKIDWKADKTPSDVSFFDGSHYTGKITVLFYVLK